MSIENENNDKQDEIVEISSDTFTIDNSSFNTIAVEKKLPKEVADEIKKIYEVQTYPTSSTVQTSVTTQSAILRSQTSNTRYYTYNGKKMMELLIYDDNCDTNGYRDVATGGSAKDIAGSIVSMGFTVAAQLLRPIGWFSTGISLLQDMLNFAGVTVISSSYDDVLQVKIRWQCWKKWTYCDLGMGYELGLTSCKVYIKEMACYQNYKSLPYDKSERFWTIYPNVTKKSPHFDTSDATAIQWAGNPLTEMPMIATMGGLLISLA